MSMNFDKKEKKKDNVDVILGCLKEKYILMFQIVFDTYFNLNISKYTEDSIRQSNRVLLNFSSGFRASTAV